MKAKLRVPLLHGKKNPAIKHIDELTGKPLCKDPTLTTWVVEDELGNPTCNKCKAIYAMMIRNTLHSR